MDAETAFWEERGEGAAATLGKFANDLGCAKKIAKNLALSSNHAKL